MALLLFVGLYKDNKEAIDAKTTWRPLASGE